MAGKEYHAPMHSAEHILNGTMDQMFGCGRAIVSHIERKKSKCDYDIRRDLSESEITEVVKKVNEVIAMNLDITEEFIDAGEADKRFDMSRVPEAAGDRVRVVKVGDYDSCPCIGNHVKNTSEIGTFRIVSSDFDGNKLRIRFKLANPI